MATAAAAVAGKTKARAGGTARASRVQINSSNQEDNTTHLQLQRLRAHAVFSVSLANTIANLAWGVRRG